MHFTQSVQIPFHSTAGNQCYNIRPLILQYLKNNFFDVVADNITGRFYRLTHKTEFVFSCTRQHEVIIIVSSKCLASIDIIRQQQYFDTKIFMALTSAIPLSIQILGPIVKS